MCGGSTRASERAQAHVYEQTNACTRTRTQRHKQRHTKRHANVDRAVRHCWSSAHGTRSKVCIRTAGAGCLGLDGNLVSDDAKSYTPNSRTHDDRSRKRCRAQYEWRRGQRNERMLAFTASLTYTSQHAKVNREVVLYARMGPEQFRLGNSTVRHRYAQRQQCNATRGLI